VTAVVRWAMSQRCPNHDAPWSWCGADPARIEHRAGSRGVRPATRTAATYASMEHQSISSKSGCGPPSKTTSPVSRLKVILPAARATMP
jgi:hypothetical protein